MKRKSVCLSGILLSLIMVFILQFSTVAYAKVGDFFDKIYNPGSGGGIVVYVDSNHTEEAKNFANVNSGMIECKSCINTWYFNRPDKNVNYNNIDYVIYMIDELEKLAMNYTNNDRRKANNCVFGYIRGINNSYADSDAKSGDDDSYGSGLEKLAGGKWGCTAGKIDKEFVKYVAQKEKSSEISFPEFFASFVQNKDNYNSFLYGAVDDTFLNKHYLVPDPLGSGQSIDLLHMLASMDGIYEYTDKNEFLCVEAFLSEHYQKDLLSWTGDLHQLTNSVALKGKTFKEYNPADGYIDFNIHTGGSNFSSDDLLADIDAYNIIKFFIDCEKNSISNSFLGYYNSIKKDKATIGNRFCEFIYTVTLEIDHDRRGTLIEDFWVEVCETMNISYKNGNFTNYEYHNFVHYNMYFLTQNNIFPNTEIRISCAKLFCDYIIAMSGR